MACLLDYNDSDEFDPKSFLDLYFKPNVDKLILKGTVEEPVELILKALASEHICGGTMIDASLGPMVHQMFPAYDRFDEIDILDTNKKSLEEINKWRNKDEDAHDWGFAAQIVVNMGDKSISAQEIEDTVRDKVKYAGQCDFSNKNPASPKELPEATCIISLWLVDSVSKDRKTFQRNLKHLLSMLKPGGYLIFAGDCNSTFYVIGEKKFCTLTYDEAFLRQALTDAGCVIKIFEGISHGSPDLYDTKKTMFVVAQKSVEKNVTKLSG